MTWRHVWKFRLLLVALLALLGVEPFLGDVSLARVCYTTLWSLVLIATIYAISDIRWQRYLGIGLVTPILAGIWGRHLLATQSEVVLELPAFGLAAVFLAGVAVLVMQHLVTSEVTTDK